MPMTSRRLWLIATLALLSSLLTLAQAAGSAADAKPHISNKWRIECSGAAHSAGVIEFRVTPHEGTPVTVSVAITKDRGENAVARDIRDAFRTQLATDRFHVETDDGEDVLVKKKGGQPDFALELIANSVEHVKLKLERE